MFRRTFGAGLRFASRIVGAGLGVWLLVAAADDDEPPQTTVTLTEAKNSATKTSATAFDANCKCGTVGGGRCCGDCVGSAALDVGAVEQAERRTTAVKWKQKREEEQQHGHQHQHHQYHQQNPLDNSEPEFQDSTCLQWLRTGLLLGASGIGISLIYYAIRLTKAWKQATISELTKFATDPFSMDQVDTWDEYTVGPQIHLHGDESATVVAGDREESVDTSLVVLGRAVESRWLTEMTELARAGRRKVDAGDLFVACVNALLAAPAAVARRWREGYYTQDSLWNEQQMPEGIHPNWNWLRGSRWKWEDGAQDLRGLAALAQSRAYSHSALNNTPNEHREDALHYAIFSDDGSLLISVLAEQKLHRPPSGEANEHVQRVHHAAAATTTPVANGHVAVVQEIQRHAKALQAAVLSAELSSLAMSDLHRLAAKRGVTMPHQAHGDSSLVNSQDGSNAASVLTGKEPSRSMLTALLLQQAGGTELLASLDMGTERRDHPESGANLRPPSRGNETTMTAPTVMRCRPCAANSAGGLACGRWSANASHLFVAWNGCGVHVLQPLGHREAIKGSGDERLNASPPPSLRSTLIGTRANTASAAIDWLALLKTAFSLQSHNTDDAQSGSNGGAVVVVGGTRAYHGASKWRRAA